MRPWQAVVLGVLCTLFGIGVIWLVTRTPRGEPVQLLPAPTAQPLVVHVTGAVRHPGVYRLSAGSRVEDAVQAAGGMLADADMQSVNMAAPLEDGQRIVITTTKAQAESPVPNASSQAEQPFAELININTASAAELEKLPGIGPSLAQRIVDFRQEYGPFSSIEEVMEVSGIGAEKFEQIKNLISISS